MKRQLIFFFVLLLVVLPVYAEAAVARNVEAQEAFSLVDQRNELFLLDVRTLGEYQQVRLEGAQLIPIGQLIKRLDEVKAAKELVLCCWTPDNK